MKCKYCGKEHEGSYASGEFCSATCARNYSRSFIKRDDIKKCNCSKCGKEIYIKRTASAKSALCEDCLREKNKRTCPICGATLYKGEKCQNEFCKKMHNRKNFKILIKFFGFDESKLGTPEAEHEYNRIRDYIYDLYWNKNISSGQIAKMYGYSQNNTIQFIKHTLKIKTKSMSKAVNETLEQRKSTHKPPKYVTGYHTSWDSCTYFLRSSYEFDFAKELDSKKIHYEVETLKIIYWDSQQKRNRMSTPDFYIPATNTIVEIKSNATIDIINMKDRFDTYISCGYNAKLILEHQEVDIYELLNTSIVNRKIIKDEEFTWINKDGVIEKCFMCDVENKLKDGWRLGRKSDYTDLDSYLEYKKRIYIKQNSRYVFKDKEIKQINKTKVDEYIKNGWKLKTNSGAPFGSKNACYNTIYIHKGDESIRIKKDLLDDYISNGWEVGRVMNDCFMYKIENENLYIKRVKLDKVENYIRDGWERGRILDILYIKKTINNKKIVLKITKKIFPKYYNDGWRKLKKGSHYTKLPLIDEFISM